MAHQSASLSAGPSLPYHRQVDAPPLDSEAHILVALLRAVAISAPLVMGAYDRDGRILVHTGRGVAQLGLRPDQLVGANVFDAFAGAGDALRLIRAALRGEIGSNTQAIGDTIWDNWFGPLRDSHGEIIGAMTISNDVTDRERTRVELERRLEVIARMSTPIIHVWEGVLVLPIIGELDADRTARMTEALLAALITSRARFAILDLTGVETVDTHAADVLLQIVGAIGLLGVKALVSGIRPAVAEAVVDLGVDLSRVTTVATLHAALRMCMEAQSQR